MKNDVRDWFVIGVITCAWTAATVYLFVHPGIDSFTVWAGLAATMIGAYHWLVVYDSKHQDADNVDSH